MQQISSRINIKRLTLIPLLLSIPFISFLLLVLYTEHGECIDSFFEGIFSIIPESIMTFIEYPLFIVLLCSIFLICCVSSFFCGKVISEKNRYIYLIKCFMCIFWIVGMWLLFYISAEYFLITDDFLAIAVILLNTTIWLLFKAVVDIIQFVYDTIKNRKHKPSK